jgi:biopolymer transport protein ExbB
MRFSAAQARPRLAAWLLGGLTAVFLFAACPAALSTARAQDEEKKTDDAKEKDKSDSKKDEPAKPPSLFTHIVKSAGWVFGPLLLIVSIILVWLIVLLAMDLRMGAAIPPGFVDDFTETVNKRRFKEAYQLASEDGSFLGRVMTTGMARLQYGIEDAREAAGHMVESIKSAKEQMITYLATIGTLGPLLGLVGTVYGMIQSFMVLSYSDTPKPKELASGISHALVVTLLGIGMSVPAIFCHAFFRNRLNRIAMDTSTIADDLLTQMYHNSKKPAPVAAVAPVPVVVDPIPLGNDRAAMPTAAIKK